MKWWSELFCSNNTYLWLKIDGIQCRYSGRILWNLLNELILPSLRWVCLPCWIERHWCLWQENKKEKKMMTQIIYWFNHFEKYNLARVECSERARHGGKIIILLRHRIKNSIIFSKVCWLIFLGYLVFFRFISVRSIILLFCYSVLFVVVGAAAVLRSFMLPFYSHILKFKEKIHFSFFLNRLSENSLCPCVSHAWQIRKPCDWKHTRTNNNNNKWSILTIFWCGQYSCVSLSIHIYKDVCTLREQTHNVAYKIIHTICTVPNEQQEWVQE